MKKYTKKFLNRPVIWNGSLCTRKENANKAKEVLEIPPRLYVAICKEFSGTKLINSICERADDVGFHRCLETAFAAGVAVGWAEKNEKIK